MYTVRRTKDDLHRLMTTLLVRPYLVLCLHFTKNFLFKLFNFASKLNVKTRIPCVCRVAWTTIVRILLVGRTRTWMYSISEVEIKKIRGIRTYRYTVVGLLLGLRKRNIGIRRKLQKEKGRSNHNSHASGYVPPSHQLYQTIPIPVDL